LTHARILAWADAHRAATGRWPKCNSGPIAGTRGETWTKINDALHRGSRGLPGGSSLAQLLSERRRVWNRRVQPRLTVEQILAWAEAHHAAHGQWPTIASGPVAGAPDETWLRIHGALLKGNRGLPGGESLKRLLDAHAPARRLPLTPATIRAWAVAHHRASGLWPMARDGPVIGAPGEYWCMIDKSLRFGRRGLPGGTTLAKLLGPLSARDPNPRGARPRLTIDQVLAWIQVHRAATGAWPRPGSGPVAGVPGESWVKIQHALRHGERGLPAGTSLEALIRERLDPTARLRPPDMTVEQILAWADAHHAATGRWPAASSGAVTGAPGEKWGNLDAALHKGSRGLPSGLSLSKLLALHRKFAPGGERAVPRG
jgi:hypothetical protein